MRVLILILALASGMMAQAIKPPGFEIDDIVAPGTLVAASTFDIASDGRIFVAELATGRIFTHRAGVTGLVGTLPGVVSGLESGLLGLAIDPAWPRAPYIYVYHTTMSASGSRSNVLRRIRVEGEVARPDYRPLTLGSALDLLTGIDAQADQHNGGALQFGADGHLFLGVGDNSDPCRAQNLSSANGKVLRLRVAHLHDRDFANGAIQPRDLAPANRAFSGPDPITALVFAMGLRNPFRLSTDAASGGVIIGDVGENDFEEINIAFGGENFGWPWLEGNTPFSNCGLGPPPTGLTAPAIVLNHAPPENFDVAIPFGGLYRSRPGARFDFGPTYDLQLMFTDFGSVGPIVRSSFDPTTSAWVLAGPVAGQFTPQVWGTIPFVVESRIAGDGAVYFTTLIASRVARLRPTAAGRHLVEIGSGLPAGTAGELAFSPFTVSLQDSAGNPIAGEKVVFSVESGEGSMSEYVVETDANGTATANYRFAVDRPASDPKIVVWHPAASPVSRTMAWRGISSAWLHDQRGNLEGLELSLKISTASQPFLLAAQLSPISTPYTVTPHGPVWTTVLTPTPDLSILGDGVGAFGSPSPLFATDANGEALIRLKSVPLTSGTVFNIQAYALEPSLPYPASLFLSNRLHLTTP
jgi:glucose/sorbosone dehydrogenase